MNIEAEQVAIVRAKLAGSRPAAALLLRQAGLSYDKIAAALGISRRTAHRDVGRSAAGIVIQRTDALTSIRRAMKGWRLP